MKRLIEIEKDVEELKGKREYKAEILEDLILEREPETESKLPVKRGSESRDDIINKDLNRGVLYSYYDDAEKYIVVIMDSMDFESYMDKKGFENKYTNGRYHMYIQNKMAVSLKLEM